jgi:cell division protein FtsB
MQPLSLERRVTNLEQKVEKLDGLPDRVTALEVQISEFRAEVRAEFSATRTELRQEMRALNDETRAEMRALTDETRAEMHVLTDETRAEMRALFENAIDRIAVISEGRKKPNGRRKR